MKDGCMYCNNVDKDKILSSIKPRMLYDGTVLKNMFSTQNSDRTGVYFVVLNVLIHFLKKSDFLIDIYCNSSHRKAVEHALENINLGYLNLVTEKNLDLSKYNIFFSPFSPAPSIIQQSNIAKYLILYDMTPIILDYIETPNKKWFGELQDSFRSNCNYITISKCTKRDFISYYKILEKRNIIYSYISTNKKFSLSNDKKDFLKVKEKYNLPDKYVLSLCTLQPRKNLIHVIECFIEFISENNIDDLYLVLCGGYWDIFIDEIKNKIIQCNALQKYIILTGYIEDADLQPIYSNAMFFVYLSLYEGFGMPVLEAMKCGCPVITSDVSSMPEVIGEAGLKIDPYDPVQLINGYKKFYYDREYRDKCKYDGLERAKLFTWDKFIDEVTYFIFATMDTRYKTSVLLKLRDILYGYILSAKYKFYIHTKEKSYIKILYVNKIPLFFVPKIKNICRRAYRFFINIVIFINRQRNKSKINALYNVKMKNNILINTINRIEAGKYDMKTEFMKIQKQVKELKDRK